HAERLGSNVMETDSSQSATATKSYDAFGLLIASSGSSSSPFGYVGQQGYQSDADSGLMLLGHRYYDPSTGRSLTRDRAKNGRNWYDYCANKPTKCVDRDGQVPAVIAIALVDPEPISKTIFIVAAAVVTLWCIFKLSHLEDSPVHPPDSGPPGGTIRGPRTTRRYNDKGWPQVDRDWDPREDPPDHSHDWPGGPAHEGGRRLPRPPIGDDPPPPWRAPGQPPYSGGGGW
ncbi:MAG: hypothetical protein HYR64_05320, partial [Fimbriimonas ginsengisoli]|nr:hypothetical protein [Fimbriimonas ginsengisoli]